MNGHHTCIDFLDEHTVKIKLSQEQELNKSEKPLFQFDRAFSFETVQSEIFEVAAKPVVESVLEGFNGTIFAYGQTSSGKTHTMQGPSIDDEVQKGIIPRMVDYVFRHIQ
jgi:kinesin family protein 5